MATRKSFSGAAVATVLAAPVLVTDTTIYVAATTNWPNTAVGPFIITIDRGFGNEEKVKISSYSGGTLTVASGGRGWDGTTAQAHTVGVAGQVNCTIDADTIDKHEQFVTQVGTVAPAASAVGDVTSNGVSTLPAAADHKHAREAFGGAPPASAVGDAGNAGVAATPARSDHKHPREAAGTPGNSAPGDAAAQGSGPTIAFSDHVHGREGATPAGLIYPTVGQVLTNNVPVTLVFGSTSYTRGGMTVSGNTLIAPTNGLYLLMANVCLGGTSGVASLTILVSGAAVAVGQGKLDGNDIVVAAGAPVVLTAGQAISAQVNQISGVSQTTFASGSATYNFLSATRLSV